MLYVFFNNKKIEIALIIILITFFLVSCSSLMLFKTPDSPETDEIAVQANVILLRHSTGGYLFNFGNRDHNANDGVNNPSPGVGDYFSAYNNSNGTNYQIQKRAFPGSGYTWENYPYDYWRIFVEHGDDLTFSGQDTLKTLTQDFDIIILKHCYPGAEILVDVGSGSDYSISSSRKSIENYKLQYEALKAEMLEYPNNKFIVWTLALRTESQMGTTYRTNSKDFVDWVRDTWDEPGDNIFLWDLYYLQTNEESVQYLYYPNSSSDSHPSDAFNNAAGPLFAQRVIDVIRGEGDTKPITGEANLGDWNLVP